MASFRDQYRDYLLKFPALWKVHEYAKWCAVALHSSSQQSARGSTTETYEHRGATLYPIQETHKV